MSHCALPDCHSGPCVPKPVDDKYKTLLLAIVDEIEAISIDGSETEMERIASIREVCARVKRINS